MPYYVYKILEGENSTTRKLELQQEFDDYKLAKNNVREMRAKQSPDDHFTFKIIFAESETVAKQQLREIREKPILKEWEK